VIVCYRIGITGKTHFVVSRATITVMHILQHYNQYIDDSLDGPLHRLGQIVMNTLDLQVTFQTCCTQLSADSAHLETSERHTSVQHAILVAPDSTCDQRASHS
jgi:hypothetical protein